MKRIVVVGGGIAGLATAYELRERAARVPGGLDVRLVEAAPRLGGNLRTERDGGYRVEWGPNGFLDNVPETLDLVRRLGLEAELCPSDAAAARRFFFRNGRLHLLPSGPGSFLTCPVLSLPGRLRVLGEPFAAKHPGGDETVYEFARRRIGPEAAHVLVGAMVSGVFAGDARQLSLASCFPKMAEMEAEHGGLVSAMLAKQRARGAARRRLAELRARGEDAPEMERPGGPVGPAGRLTSFRGGIQTFTDALGAALGPAVESGRALERLERIDAPEVIAGSTRLWRLALAGGELLEADEVVLAVPAAQAAPLLAPLDAALGATLGAIPSASLAVLALAYDEKVFHARALTQSTGAPNGFGFLVPRDPSGAGPRILGALWDSSVFPGERAPLGKVLLRVMIGGALDPEAVALPEDELLAVARTDLATTMGLETAPEHHWLFRHRVGISQYTVGHGARLATIAVRLATLPGLHIAGQSYFGVSMNGCCEQAARFAEERVAALECATA
ncbi:MAG: protoporphyrinogen/coproporphyrinogen oxidase [Acidobacteriota bacterium]|nr:protoporphyrinogen/coproporphyrinogen oxidase [Acidobacteriota bacterium]